MRATSTTADPPPPAALWTLPTIGFGLFYVFYIPSPSGMPELLMLPLFAAVCATPIVAAFVDSRAIVPVWLAGTMPVVATVAIALSSGRWGSNESGAVEPLLAMFFVSAYTCFVVAIFMLRFVLRYLLRSRQ
jgi:hypothetical protein